MTPTEPSAAGMRGPSEHEVRSQIIEAAAEYFSHYGYDKTTVADLARAIGFSKAYIYKFFDSKRAIGEVICAMRLSEITAAVDEAVAAAPTAAEQLRRLFKTLVDAGGQLFFKDRKLYDIAATATQEAWPATLAYCAHIVDTVRRIVQQGRAAGEFERKTPLDETVGAIALVIYPYANPLLLQYHLDHADEAATQLSGLILRSLAA